MRLLLPLALLLAAACGLSDLPVGVSCARDSDCATGLSCRGIRIASVTDTCTEHAECTLACSTDAECQVVDPNLHCAVASCGGARMCVR